MPIKEIMSLALAAVVGIAVAGGPQNLTQNLRKASYQMAKKAFRTDDWGTPAILLPAYRKDRGTHSKKRATLHNKSSKGSSNE